MARRLLFILFTFFCCSIKAQTVHFAIQAHADDWQLFMSSRVISDMTVANTKMVIITLTAGDESTGAGSYGGGGVPFFVGRENGAVYSSKFAADLTTGTTPLNTPVASAVTINSNTVWKYTYKNTVNYFFRLPDGDLNGAGFNNNHNQSLQKLKLGTIAAINVVGNTSNTPLSGPAALTYTWSELTATIRQIINDEKVTGTQSWIHAAHTINGTNSVYNPNDHSDHRYTSLAGQEAVVPANMLWVGVNGFMDYNSSSQAANLSTTQHTNAAILFGLEVFGMTESQYQNEFVPGHKDWLPMDYFQVIRNPAGNAPLARTNEEANDAVGTLKKESEGTESGAALTKIPMIISVTSPAFVNKDITMSISPYEAGQLSTTIYDTSGNKVYDLVTAVKNRDALFVTLKNAVKTKGSYVIKSILNNRFIESWNITVE